MTKLMPAALAVVAVTAALLQLPGRAAAVQLPASCGDLGIPVVIGSQVYATKYVLDGRVSRVLRVCPSRRCYRAKHTNTESRWDTPALVVAPLSPP